MLVMKFGGASLADIESIRLTCQIVKYYTEKNKVILVVSAMKGVTDKLYEISKLIEDKKISKALQIFQKLKKDHLYTLQLINTGTRGIKVQIELIRLFEILENFLKNVIKKEMTKAREDYIVSFGERFSCRLIAEALEHHHLLAYPIDASYIMATTAQFGNATPIYKKTEDQIKEILNPLIHNNIIPVITGFIGFSHDGCTTTLGRGGSDLSAAFFAQYLNAKALYLWKDVEGFFSANPKVDKTAKLLTKMSYTEAYRMAKNGAKIIYHKAIAPVKKNKIPIYIKSFLNPEAKGTVIS